jgi:hypothetical protein
MAKDNWKGTSGWGTITDPTGVLSGKVLVATGGVSANAEDYVLTDIGTSNSFSLIHYSVYMNYAWNEASDTHPMSGGHFSAIARATTFSGSPSLANNCYLGQVDILNKKVKIIRRHNNVEETLLESTLNSTYTSRGDLHSLELRCYDTDPVTIQVYLDDTLVANIGDTDPVKKLTSGVSGIESYDGTVYIDNYSIYEYTSTGVAPADWTPTSLSTVKFWVKADEGVTYDAGDNTVTVWNDQSGSANNLNVAAPTNEPLFVASATNNMAGISFDGTNHYMSAPDAASLDLNSTGATVFVVMSADTIGATMENILDKGASYSIGLEDDGSTNINAVGAELFGGNAYSTNLVVTTSTFQIISFVSNTSAVADTTKYGFWVDGTNQGNIAVGLGSDNTDVLSIGGVSGVSFFDGTVCEIILCGEEMSLADRQKVEGYLAHRWATWPRLPTTHPYYRVAPTV